jgi:SAM-dependent methyltransferase
MVSDASGGALSPPTVKGLEGLTRTFDMGPRLAGHVVDLCELAPDDRVLDVGCGIGRVALPLTEHLGPAGSYEGFDIVEDAIEWCRTNITARHPNFRFRHADLHNDRYNPTGSLDDTSYVFPFEDASFDVVILTSVFTHMLPVGLAQYTGEIARVLRPGGRVLVTMFLLNPESNRLRVEPESMFAFAHDRGVYALHTPDPPEAAVAYSEDYVRGIFDARRLELQVFYGSWCGRSDYLDMQDVIVGRRPR